MRVVHVMICACVVVPTRWPTTGVRRAALGTHPRPLQWARGLTGRSVPCAGLDGNLLTDIPYTTFDRQVNLVELFVSGNRIRSLDPALFFPLRRLSRLYVLEAGTLEVVGVRRACTCVPAGSRAACPHLLLRGWSPCAAPAASWRRCQTGTRSASTPARTSGSTTVRSCVACIHEQGSCGCACTRPWRLQPCSSQQGQPVSYCCGVAWWAAVCVAATATPRMPLTVPQGRRLPHGRTQVTVPTQRVGLVVTTAPQ